LALRHALSTKARASDIIVVADIKIDDGKTKGLAARFAKMGVKSALVVDGAEVEKNFKLAARNIPNVDVLPVVGINVYDILRKQKLVLTKAALEALEARFK
jgi:large subunit ribosomal protein L4